MQTFISAQDQLSVATDSKEREVAQYLISEIAYIDTSKLSNSAIIAILTDPKVNDVRKVIKEAVDKGETSTLFNNKALYKRLSDLDVNVRKKQSKKFYVRLAKAALSANLPFLELASDYIRPDVISKTLEEFMKGSILDYELPGVRDEVEKVQRAKFVLTKYVDLKDPEF